MFLYPYISSAWSFISINHSTGTIPLFWLWCLFWQLFWSHVTSRLSHDIILSPQIFFKELEILREPLSFPTQIVDNREVTWLPKSCQKRHHRQKGVSFIPVESFIEINDRDLYKWSTHSPPSPHLPPRQKKSVLAEIIKLDYV